MKKIISILLAVLMLLPYCGALAGAMDDIALDEDLLLDEDMAAPEDGEKALDEENGGEEDEEEEIPWVEYNFDWLEVGNPTVTDGKFFTGCWGNATSDIDVRTLLHRYIPVIWDGDYGQFRFNDTVVNGAVITENEQGDRTYMLAFYDDMFYSDGTPITCWDYAFSLLLMIDPKINDLGTGQAAKMPHFEGYEEYISGEVPYLSGVRVVSDYLMSFTVKHEYLPYFFELYRLGFVPYPIHVIAPGCKVYDDGQGVYIANEDRSIEEPIFTLELLEETIMDPDTGYLTHPSVVSGPYVLTYYGPRSGYVMPVDEEDEAIDTEAVTPDEIDEDYTEDASGEGTASSVWPFLTGASAEEELLIDGEEDLITGEEEPEKEEKAEQPETETEQAEEAEADAEAAEEENKDGLSAGEEIIAVFEINPYFKGDEHGDKPTIKRLCYRLGVNETMIEELGAGQFALLNKVTRKDAIEAGIALTGGQFTMTNYPRIGLSFITFEMDVPALQEKNVRRAINHCLDKDEVVAQYVGDFGLAIDGFYGMGQWMVGLANGTLAFEPPMPEEPTPEDEKAVEELLARVDALSLDNLTHYELNVEEAIRLLEESGWTLNEEGKPYVRGKDVVRYKMLDGELTGLDFKMGYPYTNITAHSLEELHLPNLLEAGIRVELVPMEMENLHITYDFRNRENVDTEEFGDEIEKVQMYYLGDDFNIEFDPTLWFIPGDGSDPEQDNLAWVHAKMYDMADWMCRTEPNDVVTFVEKWVQFQEVFSDLLPMIPIYNNVYFDFWTKELHNYLITNYVTWGEAIVPATFSAWTEEDEMAANAEEEELSDGEIILDD